LIFIADPQLIDPHSYPDRPWPLSTFTILHTDNYLKRSYILLQKSLHPDTVFFLGDLFDGGREWKTFHGNSDDPEWAAGQRPKKEQALVKTWRKKYGEDFWLQEYNRFGKIFFEHWNDGGAEPGVGQRGRKIMASLPGNHDLGFGVNVKVAVRNRFQAYFGDTNRVDVIGNHTFVSVDSVSLSASDIKEPVGNPQEIYGPVDDFLKSIQHLKRKAVARELRYQRGEVLELRQEHTISDLKTADFEHLPSLDPGDGSNSFPTILLTHVPLYRDSGTPCGPLRERWPPTPPPAGQTQPVNPDERNAISLSKGYQYQNVLSYENSFRLISTIEDVVHVFSGDDHDYCEVVHTDKENVREITVKSMSWAMGVRKPGFLMLSMWNPVDANGAPTGTHGGGHGAANPSGPAATTLESHLCLLPDQIGILIRYGVLVGVTLIVLIARAVLTPFLGLTPFAPSLNYSSYRSLLPTSSKDTPHLHSHSPEEVYHLSGSSNSSTSSTSSNNGTNLAPRNTAARTRSVSQGPGGYGMPPSQERYVPPLIDNIKNTWNEDNGLADFSSRGEVKAQGYKMEAKRVPLTKAQIVLREAWSSVWRVTWVVGWYYLYLARYG
jgi:ethanolamine phosphate phosphodiesterase